MKNYYRTLSALILAGVVAKSSFAQTHYGLNAGTMGLEHAFFGTEAGKVNEEGGVRNTFLGYQTGLANTNGSYNTFIGTGVGKMNTKGSGNTFTGSQSGLSNTTGSLNTFTGAYAGFQNTSGEYNVFLGGSAGQNNTQGSHNSFVGAGAGGFNNTGSHNSFFGKMSGYRNKSGSSNTYMGDSTGFDNSTGSLNTLIGSASGYHLNGGSSNAFVGSKSGYSNSTGNSNAFIGDNAGYGNTSGSSNTFVGSQSGYLADAGTANAFVGMNSGYSNSIGNNNAFLGYGAGYDNTSGEKNTYLGFGAGGNPTLINATAVGAQAKVTASNSLVLGKNANVGIGISSPAYQLQLSTESAAKLGSPSWTIWSDKRLKKDISDFTDGLNLLKQIKPVWFKYNGEAGIKSDRKFVGILAQEMQQIAPYTIGSSVYQDSLGNKTEYLDYDANAVTYILINSVKEQQKIIEEKESKIQEVTAQVVELAKRLEQLERIVASETVKPLTSNPAAKFGGEHSVILKQNAPNGFSQNTSIKYFIPQSVKEARIDIYTIDGVKVQSYNIQERGESTLELNAKTFKSGMHVYDLVTDGKSNGARKMLVN